MRLAIMILITMLMSPGFAFGMHPVTDKGLDEVRAQAGVDLLIDDVAFYQHFEPQSFVDSEGMDLSGEYPKTGNTEGAKVTLGDMGFELLTVEAISPDSNQVGEHAAELDITESSAVNTFESSALTIDSTSRLPAMSRGVNYGLNLLGMDMNNVAGIKLGLPTANVFIQNFYLNDIDIDTIANYGEMDNKENAINDGASFGRIKIDSLNFALLDGNVEIGSHAFGTGISLAFNDIVMYSEIKNMKYIDWDGSQNMVVQKSFGGPASIDFEQIELDVLRVNAITHAVDTTNGKELRSVGEYGLKLYDSGPSMDNYDLNDWHAQPFMIDATEKLPRSTKIHRSSGGSGNIAGLHVQQQTMELYADKLTLNFSIQNEDPDFDKNVQNNGAHFFQVRDKGIKADFLSGAVEIAPH